LLERAKIGALVLQFYSVRYLSKEHLHAECTS
jgi:hypothetical protein